MRRSDLRALCHRFLSTPSARRATLQDCAQIYWLCISIHALREEGDFTEMPQTLAELQFLSTPSARRATYAPNRRSMCHAFLSTPSARRATPEEHLRPRVA